MSGTNLFTAFGFVIVATTCLVGGLVRGETNEIDRVLRNAVNRGDVPGVVAMAATSDRIIYQGAFGKRCVQDDEEMTLDSVFRIASMTKPITSVAAMQLTEEGKLNLDTPVSKHIVQFANLQVFECIDLASNKLRFRPPSSTLTVKHLLTHTAGFGHPFWEPLLRDAETAGLLKASQYDQSPLLSDPGSSWRYGFSTIWLGRLVEAVREQPLDTVFEKHVFCPLNMKNTFFNVPPDRAPFLVTVHKRQNKAELLETPRVVPRPVSFFNGGGGLYSTAPDYIRFLRALLRGGELDGARVLKAETVALMGKNWIDDQEAGTMRTAMPEFSNDVDFFPGSVDRFGLGFLINGRPVVGGRSAGSLAWAGLFNTYFWLDPTQNICGVLMTQVFPFYDSGVVELLGNFEQAVYREVGKQAEVR